MLDEIKQQGQLGQLKHKEPKVFYLLKGYSFGEWRKIHYEMTHVLSRNDLWPPVHSSLLHVLFRWW